MRKIGIDSNEATVLATNVKTAPAEELKVLVYYRVTHVAEL